MLQSEDQNRHLTHSQDILAGPHKGRVQDQELVLGNS